MLNTIPLFPLEKVGDPTGTVNIYKELRWLKIEKFALQVLSSSCQFVFTAGPLFAYGYSSFIPIKIDFLDNTYAFIEKLVPKPKLIALMVTLIAATILLFKGNPINNRLNELYFYCDALSKYPQIADAAEKADVITYLREYRRDRLKMTFENIRAMAVPYRTDSAYHEYEANLRRCISTQFVPELITSMAQEVDPETKGYQSILLSDLRLIKAEKKTGLFITQLSDFNHMWPTQEVPLICRLNEGKCSSINYTTFLNILFADNIKNFDEFCAAFKQCLNGTY